MSSSTGRRPLPPLLFLIPLVISSACSSGGGGGVVLQNGFGATLDEAQETPAPISGTRVRVTITNRAPDMGTFQTPMWVGFHDGTFDLYDLGASADTFFPLTNALERLAEDGNTAELTDAFDSMPAGSVQAAVLGALGPVMGPIAPGETVSAVFELDPNSASNRYFSYASMVIPSNDAFVASGGPMDHEIFDGAGTFVATDFVVAGGEVLDAGTEVNDEVPANTAFFGQMAPDTGVDELGTVALHPGFLAMGMGGILDDAMFANADFTAAGYETLSFTFEELAAAPVSTGVTSVELTNADSMVDFQVMASGLSGEVTGAHFHMGAVGVTGPILISLTDSITENANGSVVVAGTLPTTSAFVTALRSGDIYVNLHTHLNPSGELRGQVTTSEAFSGSLDTVQETPAPILGSDVRVTVRNRAPDMGTFQTPVWVAFHDGTFDVYDIGSAANTFFPLTNALERLAEDGTTTEMLAAFESMPAGSIQGVLAGLLFPGPVQPGETVSQTFRLDPVGASNRYLSYATMVIPSNDAFVANGGPMDHEIFDAGGTFTGADFVVTGAECLDAGTEVNDEIPMNTAFFGQMAPDTGTTEMGSVALHIGLLAMGMGGILDDPMFAMADFTAPGYEFLEVGLSESTPSTPATGLVLASLSTDESQVTFSVSARNLSGAATAMHFHEAAVGVTGPILIDLTSSIDINAAGQLTASGMAATTTAFVDALRAGEIYVNVHTYLNPSGELRGQVVLLQ